MKPIRSTAILLVLSCTLAKAAFVPLPITSGFNTDVIANGVGSGLTTTTGDVDGVNYAFAVQGWQPSSTAAPIPWGLPPSGLITSTVPATQGLYFQLAPYSANNVMRIATNGSSGTFVFGYTPGAKNLFIVATTGSGTGYFTGQINFTDNTSQPISTEILVPDWFFATTQPIAAQGFGRINRQTDALEPNVSDPRLYQIQIPILAANQGKSIESLQITKANSSTATSVLNIFAVSVELDSYNDAGVVAITQPVNFCPNSAQDIQVRIQNFGKNQINSVTVNLEVNGLFQPPVAYVNLLDTIGGAGPNTALVTVSQGYLFTSGTYTLKAWTTFPNGVPDTLALNDTTIGTAQSALSGTFTIGGTGSNYTSLAAAAQAMTLGGVCGPVVLNMDSASGPYLGQVVFTNVSGASATNTITVNGNGAVVQHNGAANEISIIKLTGASYVVLKNLNIRTTATTTTTGILLTGNSNYNTIENCVIDLSSATTVSATIAGIAFSNSSSSATTAGVTGSFDTVRNNRILGSASGGPYYGMTMFGTAGTGCTGNVVENNVFENSYLYGIYLSGASNNLISRNNISRANRTNISTFAGVYMLSTSTGNTVERNRIHNPCGGNITSTSTLYGVYLASSNSASGNENKVYNNLIYNMTGNGAIYGIYNSASSGMHVYYNTISLDNAAATAGLTRGFHQVTTASNIDFRNNIVSITRGGSGAKHALYFSTAASGIVSNGNVLYLNSAGSGAQHVGYFSSDQTSLTAWQGVNGGIYDQASLAANPMFQNLASFDLIPTASAIIGIGSPIAGIATDFAGNARSATAPDPGAYEFSQITAVADAVSGAESIRIFPNPSDGRFTLVLPGRPEGEVRIATLHGVEVQRLKASEMMEMDMTLLPAGVYILSIAENNKTVHKKFVIE